MCPRLWKNQTDRNHAPMIQVTVKKNDNCTYTSDSYNSFATIYFAY